MVRTLFLLAALNVGLAGVASGQTPLPTSQAADANQQLADAVAGHLRKCGVAIGAKMSVTTQNGVVELAGEVRSPKQAEAIVEETLKVEGVTKVETALKIASTDEIQPVNASEAPLAPLTANGAAMDAAVAFGGHHRSLPQEPLPLGAPSEPSYDQTGPKMPAHAWPTYAPYPNYSRVAYPQAYPYNAFPFIGPFYPFPKVPLGWRSVKLEWDDGHWYLGRLSTPHDYWRVKFW